MNTLIKILFLTFWVLFILTSCSRQELGRLFKEKSSYEKYKDKLTQADINKTALGSDWLSKGELALKDSIIIELPFREKGSFLERQIRASSYCFYAKQGEVISIKISWSTKLEGEIFADLFILKNYNASLITSADTALSIYYEIKENAKYLLRLQPEILRGGRYSIEITSGPSLPFPIPGKDSKSVGSFFYDLRENGTRKHEGIDIFAAKRTPVIAIVNGAITGYKENALGGKVVFLNDSFRRQTLYYAHLDTQLVSIGQHVKLGDTLGLVGNTGNAKLTLPHLHFGIYKWPGGAIDPFPFLESKKNQFEQDKGSEKFENDYAIIKGNNSFFLKDLRKKSVYNEKIEQNTIVFINGLSGNFYKVELPDGVQGYIGVNNVRKISKIKSTSYNHAMQLLEFPDQNAPMVDSIIAGKKIAIMGSYKNFNYVNFNEKKGWVIKEAAK